MANFHLSLKIHGRKTKDGGTRTIHSSVAYRHACKFGGYDYSNKKDFLQSFIIAPDNLPQEMREMLEQHPTAYKAVWQSVENKEKRKDSQFYRELEISLQHELSLKENLENLKTLLRNNFTNKGILADVCIHNSGNNLHAHVLLTQRPIEGIQMVQMAIPPELLASIKERRAKHGLEEDLDDLPMIVEFGKKIREEQRDAVQIREEWAALCNASFKKLDLKTQISDKKLTEQYKTALANEHYELAATLNREPTKYIHRNKILAKLKACGNDLSDQKKIKFAFKAYFFQRTNKHKEKIEKLKQDFENATKRLNDNFIKCSATIKRTIAETAKFIDSINHSYDFGISTIRKFAKSISERSQETNGIVTKVERNDKSNELLNKISQLGNKGIKTKSVVGSTAKTRTDNENRMKKLANEIDELMIIQNNKLKNHSKLKIS